MFTLALLQHLLMIPAGMACGVTLTTSLKKEYHFQAIVMFFVALGVAIVMAVAFTITQTNAYQAATRVASQDDLNPSMVYEVVGQTHEYAGEEGKRFLTFLKNPAGKVSAWALEQAPPPCFVVFKNKQGTLEMLKYSSGEEPLAEIKTE